MKYAIIENGNVVNIAVAESPLAENWVEAGRAKIGDVWDGTSFSPSPAGPPTVEEVKAERDRRLGLGFDYDFSDSRGIHRIGTTKEDMKGWGEVTSWANAMIALGNSSATITIVTDTGSADVTAEEWQSVLAAASEFRQPIWAAYFTLVDLDPMPNPKTWDGWP